MLEEDQTTTPASDEAPAARPRRRRAASRPAGPPEPAVEAPVVEAPADPVVAEVTPAAATPEEVEPEVVEAEVVEAEVVEPSAVEPSAVEPSAQPEDAEASDEDPNVLFATATSGGTATTRRPRRRATAAAGPPVADIFTAPPVPDLDELLPPPVSTGAPADGDDTPAPRSRGGRTRRGRGRAGTDDTSGPVLPDLPVVTDAPDTAPDASASAPADDAPTEKPARRSRSRARAKAPAEPEGTTDAEETRTDVAVPDEGPGAPSPVSDRGDRSEERDGSDADADASTDDADDTEDSSRPRRGGRSRRRRGGRGRSSSGDAEQGDDEDTEPTGAGPDTAGQDRDADDASADGGEDSSEEDDDDDDQDDTGGSRSSRRRRRRRRRSGGGEADLSVDPDDPPGTVVRIRESRADEVTKLKGSTRLEAKRQRRKDGRSTSRKRTVITEAEFLTRRESVDRTLLVREGEDRTEIAVLEDGVLVEHHVTRASQQSMIGNVHLGKVQNVLPSMEAAFVDIGRGRNAVLYAGEVNWDAFGMTGGSSRKIEDALKPGDPVLAQVSKDPIGHKGARLTAQISLPGRYLVYVPGSSMTGISRKLPENERTRLKKVLRRVVPEDAGVIVRTAAEGASEAELERDVARLKAQWEDIEAKSKAVQAPARLYSEPDLAIKVVRDVFNEDFTRLLVSGDDTWDTLDGYVRHVAPDLAERMTRWAPEAGAEQDLFVHHRIDEQIAKALDRKVWLPSGGSLVIDRTEAMTVVDVNTGKYTGNGGNLEETVTRNNLEAAEEIVRQLRLRDIGGIIVVDFIDMVLESNRNLVLRRLVECLGRDRTKHQVAEVTSLGLVQLTRKRVGSGLLESFSTPCEHCQGRGVITHSEPVGAGNEAPAAPGAGSSGGPGEGGGRGGGRSGGRSRGGRQSG
ncbi:Rne/Rng family ribonuclease [Aquipuribacter sp. MA13-6]|uniref:Rne/Rng family ribonuclease n=1 Tax=unclassified Aquipuribacter TaxID=2635084 RepID=UPI003EED424E